LVATLFPPDGGDGSFGDQILVGGIWGGWILRQLLQEQAFQPV